MLMHYIKKIITLGSKRSSQIVLSRIKDKLATCYWRCKALHGFASHTWEQVKQQYDLNNFKIFFESQRLRSLFFLKNIYAENKDKNQIIFDANFLKKNGFNIFENLHYMYKINWHIDITLSQSNATDACNFNQYLFYKDVKIKNGTGGNIQKDIKVPWELSRFQHLFVLGKAYKLTEDKKYSRIFVQQVTHWLDHNPYLFGVNWMCPMEVGLRAINWIVAFSLLKNADIDQIFWERFTCSLYDHLIYLENNWELYDSRTSNHYLSDLIGYLYLCWFFKDLDGIDKKLQWVHKEIIKEMEKQVFDEGTDYEGSTRYHQLVTELFYHAYLMFQECGLSIPQHFINKLTRMFTFIEWCTPEGGQLITIGDHDSGKVLYYGLPRILRYTKQRLALRTSGREYDGDSSCFCILFLKKNYDSSFARPECFCECKNVSKDTEDTKHFSKFGLSIIKNKIWHISLRHHAYQKYQPSGHFHNDVGSITLAINGIPVFVDPGSYVYTPSAYWRNKFRSMQVHNTCYVDGVEPVPLNNDLFFLDMSEKKSEQSFCVQHNLYKQYGLSFERSLVFEDDVLKVRDVWQGQTKERLTSAWNFTLGSDITPKKEQGVWLLQYKQQTVITLSSDLDFDVQEAWVSPEYGTKVSSLCLRAKKDLNVNTSTHIYLSLPK